MKKNSVMLKVLCGCLGLALLLPLAVNAEPGGGSRFEIGLRTGLAFGSIAGDESYLWEKTRTGFFGGTFVRYDISDVISLEMNVAYVMKGGKTSIPIPDYTGELPDTAGFIESTLITDRIEVVPLVMVTIPVHGRIRPTLLGGVSLAFGGSSKVEPDNYEPTDFSEVTTGSNWGFVVGTGLAYHLTSTRIFTYIRYQRDFGDFHESDMFEWINQVISIGVGVGFKL